MKNASENNVNNSINYTVMQRIQVALSIYKDVIRDLIGLNNSDNEKSVKSEIRGNVYQRRGGRMSEEEHIMFIKKGLEAIKKSDVN